MSEEALGIYAEAAQDMVTTGLELAIGRHFACADYCNQVAEKALQAVSVIRLGQVSPYDHNLRALGERVGAPEEILTDLEALTPYHPASFYAETPPEEADEKIDAAQAAALMECARRVLRWARGIVMTAP